MNKIICDKCQKEIKPAIESKHLTDGIRLQFFRCNSCKEKYLIDVTDKATREKVIELRKWADARKKALDIAIDGLSEENLKELAMLADETKYNIDKLQAEIKEAKRVLKEKYSDQL